MSPKIAWYALTSVSIVMVLGACMKPVDVQPFLKDKTVQEIIDSTKATVKIDNQTGDNLIPRDRRIEGLKPDRYYMVEKETDADGIPVPKYNNVYSYPVYVTDNEIAQMPGGLYPDLGFISRISAGRINGLINFHMYTVRAAEAFSDGTQFTYSIADSDKTVTVNNGAITIPGSTGTINLVHLEVQYDGFEVMAVAVPPLSLPSTSPFYDYKKKTISVAVTSFQLEGLNTEVDYVFANTDDPSDFKVLKVKIGSMDKLTLNIVWSEVEETPTLTPAEYTFSQADYYGKIPKSTTINVSNPDNTYTGIDWQYNGASLGLSSLVFNNFADDIYYLARGVHIFTVVFEKDGNPYSAVFTLTVTP